MFFHALFRNRRDDEIKGELEKNEGILFEEKPSLKAKCVIDGIYFSRFSKKFY